MNEKSTWEKILENEILQAEMIEKRLAETELDSDMKYIIKQNLVNRLKQEMIDNY